MTEADTPGSHSDRDAVIDRYSGLARTALAGGVPVDGEPDALTGGCLGAAAYADAGGIPEPALRASLGCGNPLAVADLHPGETVLAAGFTGITITSTHESGPGLHSAIVNAAKPTAPRT